MARVTFIITGFSSFHGVDENPTEQLIKWLQLQLRDGGLQHMQQEIEVQVTDKAAAAAAAHLAAAAVAAPPQPDRQRLVLLHLGVASTATRYQLESRAYNCADFRVPDEAGWQPVMEEIEAGRGLGMWVGSRLPLAGVCERLAARGHSVVVSEDAGRFVCNWAYYRACGLAERLGMEAIFVHVPPFTVFGEDKQRAFILDVIQVIADVLYLPQPGKTYGNVVA
ncbi:hypothetical protein VOLCADRAFT_62493 [Volvox carteri f. nagariensis]|uniref:Pyrrolidone-carboxylate peptidase n=1 Tax=Volvox carteri f. nagariensis TaxID=3068 RepID=D8U169_VOLCA|nr:uncharacterized protein VOLCADRAFT_62493 [Volvox carteri f. nagariensis]EFJ46505.1 hypothetical protein VOLCADRAFT_62493 [Volvox carteri f. nagariensis]|eukprot:XP_002952362.1 hypothetical protein VOLCADRAFT_62493 [Volvox carteri f. nagariensis]